MKVRFLHVAAAVLLAAASTTNVFAASTGNSNPSVLKTTHAQSNALSDAMSCHASCSSGHLQCLADGLDYSLVSSPSDGLARIESNLSVRSECASASAMCHSNCR